jgi:hypothetical protein
MMTFEMKPSWCLGAKSVAILGKLGLKMLRFVKIAYPAVEPAE